MLYRLNIRCHLRCHDAKFGRSGARAAQHQLDGAAASASVRIASAQGQGLSQDFPLRTPIPSQTSRPRPFPQYFCSIPNSKLLPLPVHVTLTQTHSTAKVCRDVITGRKHLSLAISEPGAGSDVANIQTLAEKKVDRVTGEECGSFNIVSLFWTLPSSAVSHARRPYSSWCPCLVPLATAPNNLPLTTAPSNHP